MRPAPLSVTPLGAGQGQGAVAVHLDAEQPVVEHPLVGPDRQGRRGQVAGVAAAALRPHARVAQGRRLDERGHGAARLGEDAYPGDPGERAAHLADVERQPRLAGDGERQHAVLGGPAGDLLPVQLGAVDEGERRDGVHLLAEQQRRRVLQRLDRHPGARPGRRPGPRPPGRAAPRRAGRRAWG
ncbi:hypothetical protein ACFSTC_45210 [Nonomuraea ferruginea]